MNLKNITNFQSFLLLLAGRTGQLLNLASISNDTGLLCYLLGIGSSAQLKRDPLRGSIYENLLIMEVLKTRLNKGGRPHLYFYLDSNGNEVDLLIPHGGSIQPVEIKSSSTFTPGFIKGISSLQKQLGDRCRNGILSITERRNSLSGTQE